MLGVVMIVPPPMGAKHSNVWDTSVIWVRLVFENHLNSFNEDFKSMIAKKGVRI